MLAPHRQWPPVHHLIEDFTLMQITDPDRIKIHREARRYSLRYIAQLCDCSHTQIRFYENGTTKTIPEPRAIRLAMVLGFPLASVFRPDEVLVAPEGESVPGDVASRVA